MRNPFREERVGHHYGTKINKRLCKKLKNRFVVHKHEADRAGLHYDIRLEHNCLLTSWASRKFLQAVTKETNPKKVERVAFFQTPDHNLEYFNFEGKIGKIYGRGWVSIWDTGTYDEIYWGKDKIIIKFHGRLINGIYVIIRMKGDVWLFFKKKEI